MSKIFVIIPAFNESPEIIRETLTKLVPIGYEIVLVDDGSLTDLMAQSEDIPVHYIRHEINMGQGASLQTGMDYAIQNGAEILVHFDADGQHNVEDITTFIQKLKEGNYDVVLGSRFLNSKDSEVIPNSRKFLLRVARVVNGLFTGLWLSDAHNGFRVFNHLAATKLRLTENRMAHATEILHLIKKDKLKYCEMPTHIIYTDYSKSKGQSSINSLNILIDLIKSKII